MVRAKTSIRRKKFFTRASRSKNRNIMTLKNSARVRESNPTEEILNEELISRSSRFDLSTSQGMKAENL